MLLCSYFCECRDVGCLEWICYLWEERSHYLKHNLPFFTNRSFCKKFCKGGGCQDKEGATFTTSCATRPTTPIHRIQVSNTHTIPPTYKSNSLSFRRQHKRTTLPIRLRVRATHLSQFRFHFRLSNSYNCHREKCSLYQHTGQVRLLQPIFRSSHTPYGRSESIVS